MTDCKAYTSMKKAELKKKIADLKETPKLVIIQVGDDPASNSYIKGKIKDCEEVGIDIEIKKFVEQTTEGLLQLINVLNVDLSVSGILVQLPLPENIDKRAVQNAIRPEKDVDGFSEYSPYKPCTPLGIINYLKYIGYHFEGKNACVIGRSRTVGLPLAKMLLDENCTVTVCHSRTKNLTHIIQRSDIVFTAIDKPAYFYDPETFELGQDIIDIGLGRDDTGKLCGNISRNYADVLRKFYEPTDGIFLSGVGNVGLLTRLALLENLYRAKILNK